MTTDQAVAGVVGGEPALERPEPVVDEYTRGFWDAVDRGVLAVQRCADCRQFQHPPRATCRSCGSLDLTFAEVSGHGRVYSWTTTRHAVVSSFEAVLPYVCAVVELDEQPGLFLVTDFVGRADEAAGLELGAPVHVEVVSVGAGRRLPQFVLDGAAEGSTR